ARTARDFVMNVDFDAGRAGGVSTAPVQPIAGIIIPPSATPSSTSGCKPADFASFTPGNIALIQRGGCNFGVKIQNAKDAGASGVIIFNEGQPGRTDTMGITILHPNRNLFLPDIPVVFTSFALGEELFNDAKTTLPVVTL